RSSRRWLERSRSFGHRNGITQMERGAAGRETKDSARRWFDRRAGSYEGGFTSRWRDPVQRASLDALELTPDDRLLDLGCGTGAPSRAAAAIAGSVVGVDLSPEMIRAAVDLA